MTRLSRLVPGKIPPDVLRRVVFRYLGQRDSRVIIGPGIGRDSAIIKLDKSNTLVFSTDPITSASGHIGIHAIHVNANDVAASGAKPSWFLCTILLPQGEDSRSLKSIMREIHREAQKLGITIVGGHTEYTMGIPRPLLVGFMVGLVMDGSNPPGQGKEGDRIIMTKTAGIEGTAVLAADHGPLLRERGVSADSLRKALDYYKMLSVVREAEIANQIDGVSAMHDPTEGGVQNGLWELAEVSGNGIEVLADRVPVAAETSVITRALGLDPTKLLSSGCLLILVRPSKSGRLIERLRRAGINAVEIGRIGKKRAERIIVSDEGKSHPLIPVNSDEVYRVKEWSTPG